MIWVDLPDVHGLDSVRQLVHTAPVLQGSQHDDGRFGWSRSVLLQGEGSFSSHLRGCKHETQHITDGSGKPSTAKKKRMLNDTSQIRSRGSAAAVLLMLVLLPHHQEEALFPRCSPPGAESHCSDSDLITSSSFSQPDDHSAGARQKLSTCPSFIRNGTRTK